MRASLRVEGDPAGWQGGPRQAQPEVKPPLRLSEGQAPGGTPGRRTDHGGPAHAAAKRKTTGRDRLWFMARMLTRRQDQSLQFKAFKNESLQTLRQLLVY